MFLIGCRKIVCGDKLIYGDMAFLLYFKGKYNGGKIG